jgi:AcrR family transcriptional regulator
MAMMAGPRSRADAVRNHERVIRAATEVLAERGEEAGVPEIAARAGVGKGTVYRCFPTKEHLVAAVFAERLRWFTRLAEEAAERPDAWRAFVDLLGDTAEQQAADRSLAEGMGHVSDVPVVREAREAMHAAVNRLMARAQAEGRMRPGVTSADVRVLYAGMASVLRADGNRDPAAWRRYAGLVADALRAE